MGMLFFEDHADSCLGGKAIQYCAKPGNWLRRQQVTTSRSNQQIVKVAQQPVRRAFLGQKPLPFSATDLAHDVILWNPWNTGVRPLMDRYWCNRYWSVAAKSLLVAKVSAAAVHVLLFGCAFLHSADQHFQISGAVVEAVAVVRKRQGHQPIARPPALHPQNTSALLRPPVRVRIASATGWYPEVRLRASSHPRV